MNQSKMPLYEALLNHSHTYSYHVPGHKNGKVFPEKLKDTFQAVLAIDKTEIDGLDDLHDPVSVIAEAEKLLAALYQVQKSYFLVGGATSGNMAMLLAAVSRGDTVLVQRNSHQSVFYGLELAGAKPVFLDPDRDSATGLPLGIHPDTLEAGLKEFPKAKAVFLTNPTYEGYGQSLSPHKELCSRFDALLLVDEAHGAHFLPVNESWFPWSAAASGADLVVQSAHKTLPAMTMAAWLHAGSGRVSSKKLRKALAMVQSSSPSYPLMASLDIARAYAAKKKDWKETADTIRWGRAILSQKTALLPETIGHYRLDPLKLSLLPGENSKKPDQWQKKMEAEGAYPELRSPVHLLLVLSLDQQVTKKMIDKLQQLFEEEQPATMEHCVIAGNKQAAEITADYETLEQKEEKEVVWEQAAGEVAAETIIPYPPGIPLLLRGEAITEQHVAAYQQLQEQQLRIKSGRSVISVFKR